MENIVTIFGKDKQSTTGKDAFQLGCKGFNLLKICELGVSVPVGFIIPSSACNEFLLKGQISEDLRSNIRISIKEMEKETGLNFGQNNSMLVSVRSGSAVSMPGMMDTILNLGINDQVHLDLKEKYGKIFADDTYSRFIKYYSKIVLSENIGGHWKQSDGIEDLKKEIERKEKIIPEDPYEQLLQAIKSIMLSWNNERAKIYRKMYDIPENIGTAVIVQLMVFGNLNQDSATGVVFSRNPSSGINEIYGDYLINAQGEDVVDGSHKTFSITKQEKNSEISLEEKMPIIFRELKNISKKLENYYRDTQDIEFTVQNGKLFILQTRSAKRTISAAVKIAIDMSKEGLISEKEALNRVKAEEIQNILHVTIDQNEEKNIIASGLPASPGVASGEACFSSKSVDDCVSRGKKAIMVRMDTSTEDIHCMNLASGILTTRGGVTSHAAVIARGMGKVCICGADDILINFEQESMTTSNGPIQSGEIITLDGNTGDVISGHVATSDVSIFYEFQEILRIAKETSNIDVYVNADTPNDISYALEFGVEGIGLCRTEHMFFDPEKILYMQEAIILGKKSKVSFNKIRDIQKEDFLKMMKAAKGIPYIIRLMDPPLHEFMPSNKESFDKLARHCKMSASKLQDAIESLKEKNPMLGRRGCRLGIVSPEIYKSQIEAIMLACIDAKKYSVNPLPEIMIPFVINEKEVIEIRKVIDNTASNFRIKDYKVGIMIELPAAALNAEKISKHIDFISFGTNDLTQTTLGMSRDDSAGFIEEYKSKKIIEKDPYSSIDSTVAELVSIASRRAKKGNPNIKIGICGEQAADVKTIQFLHSLGIISYVSCSQYRVPTAMIALAQCHLKN